MPEAARGVLGDSATWAEPPDGVVDAVLASIRAAAPAPSALAARSPSWRPLVAATAAMAAVVLFIAFTGGTHGPAGHTTVVAAQGSDLAPDLMGTVSIRPTGSGWWIQLEVVDLPPAPAGAYYEGWVWSGGEGVSVGTFHMRGEPGPVILWSGVDLQDYPLLTVTLQQEGEGAEPSGQTMMQAEFPQPPARPRAVFDAMHPDPENMVREPTRRPLRTVTEYEGKRG